MKWKRRRNSLNSEKQLSPLPLTISTIVATAANFCLPDECWASIFKFLIRDGNINDRCDLLNSLSLVSKQFLSITNLLRFSLSVRTGTPPFLPRLFQRFTNLTSLNLTYFCGDINALLREISHFPLNLTSLVLSIHLTIPANGLGAFSRNITTLTSLTCSYIEYINDADLFLIADCFPNLQLLDLNNCCDISEEGIAHVLKRCCNIKHLNLSRCFSVKLSGINFEVSKLEVLNLSDTKVDDETLYVISRSFRGLLQLFLENCNHITEKGVMQVVMSCTQLREVNLGYCVKLHANIIDKMLSSRPSLRKINAPPGSHHGCIVC